MFKCRIAGLGSYLPERVVGSDELESRWNLEPGWIERRTGIRERRYVAGETSAQMGANAALKALEQAELSADDIDLIIGASVVPYQAIPCSAVFIQRELGIAEGGCPCFDVNATCLSFLFALHTSAHFVHSGAYHNVLIVSSEIISSWLNPLEPESAALFGDAAAAVIVTAAPERDSGWLHGAKFVTDSTGANLTQVLGGGSLHHPNDASTTPEMNLFAMNGPGVFKQAVRQMPGFLEGFFERIEWDREEVDAFVPHQASQHGLRLLTDRLGFRPDQVVSNIATRGNCGAASIPLLLTESVAAGCIKRGQRILLAGTGAGLSMGAIGMTF